MSWTSDDSARNELIRGGAIAFFIKPFDDAELLAAVYLAMASTT